MPAIAPHSTVADPVQIYAPTCAVSEVQCCNLKADSAESLERSTVGGSRQETCRGEESGEGLSIHSDRLSSDQASKFLHCPS